MDYLIIRNGQACMARGRNLDDALAELSACSGDDPSSPPEIIEVPEQHLSMAYADAGFYYSWLVQFGLAH